MRFQVSFTLSASDGVDYTTETVEALVDAFHDVTFLEDVDAEGSLASHELVVNLVLDASDIDEAQELGAMAVTQALASIGGAIVNDHDGPVGTFRKTGTAVKELATA